MWRVDEPQVYQVLAASAGFQRLEAKIGRSVETVLRHQDVQALKRSPAEGTLTVPARRAVQVVLEKLVTEKNRGPLASRLKAGRVVYQSDPAG